MLLKEIKTKLSIDLIYNLMKSDNDESAFLYSSLQTKQLGEYSFIGINSFLKIEGFKGKYFFNGEEEKGDFFKALKSILKKYKVENYTHMPFISGGIGYLSYDLGRTLEIFDDTAKENVDIPLGCFNFYDNLIIFDHIENKTYISSLGILEEEQESLKEIKNKISSYEKSYFNKLDVFENVILDNKKPQNIELTTEKLINEGFKSNFKKDEYKETIDKVKKYIEEGHIYITNLTQQFVKSTDKDPYEVYKDLMELSPAPFSAYLDFKNFKIISSSPERFIQINNGKVITRPIKGTRPRGNSIKEDENNKKELINSEKDKSELLMIVDLERNDLSKVCKQHTVNVTELFKIEEYSTVFHLVSNIEGKLREDNDMIDCIKATFPGGSITGAPKIRSMEIIEELEKVKRNIYTGALGYISFHDTCDLNIIIRTILQKNNKAYFGVGGGITCESESQFEYEETLHKAKAMVEALIK
ncbi:aminodeoxychorismate synthase component I [Hathewaya limosa]|uniref:Anthranilate synthase component 1 n=1 Tax=Hathewaya limosa TaxID=1536 RepID=A0ABU0JSX6_HATLI|nr:para-aminobenzoate synthetase component 1 [Hathewaya limosa]